MDKKRIIKANKELQAFYKVSHDVRISLDCLQCDLINNLRNRSRDAANLHDAVARVFTELRNANLTVQPEDKDEYGLAFYLKHRGDVANALVEILTKDE